MMCIKRKTLALILCMISLSLGACGASGDSDPTSVARSVQATLTALAPGPAITLVPIDDAPEATATATVAPVPTLVPTATASEVPPTATPEPSPTLLPTQEPTPTEVPATDVPAPTASPTPPGELPPSDLTKEESLVELINQHRSVSGLPPLGLATELTVAARRHSQDMAAHSITTHTGSDGSDGGQRIYDAGYNWSTWDEMIGWGFADAASVINWWANDAVHGPMLLATDVTEIGVGYVWDPNSEWVHYWTVDFASRN